MTATAAPFKYVPPRVNETEAKQKIWASLKDALDRVYLFRNQVLVVKHSHDKIGSFYRTDKSRDEDKWQGKVGLVVKIGKLAYVDDDQIKFHGEKVELGDWVVYRHADGWDIDITPDGWGGDKIHCKVLEEAHIKAVIDEPDLVY